jgi:hypothetical protein
MSKTRIIILQIKELIYTGIFIALGLFLVLLLVLMFHSTKEETKEPSQDTSLYRAGICTVAQENAD